MNKLKIALIWTDHKRPWPPKGWGAIEKYIWEYKTNLEELGHIAELRYSNSLDLKDFHIVQSHTWNQSLNLKKREIPYIYSFDDSHVVYYGKESDLFNQNLEAIQSSKLTIVHAKYLKEFFGSRNVIYLRHGANPNKFKYLNRPIYQHKLLCVGRTDQDDRKGFGLAVEAARKLGLEITIVGPNREFFRRIKLNYDKLTIIDDRNDEELLEIYNDHTIFLHPSKLETGHPNLTLIESIYCGTPVVGICNINIDGMKNIEKIDLDSLVDGIKEVMDDYSNYQNLCFKCKNDKFYDWENITKDLLSIYLNF